ncbi:type I pullulanase [Anaerococcus sp.]|uniref:type I pullulanase n=1 Tax=Anaerococcus sp. TaxID=1872515 RepID=UPI002A7643E2|nr:type I pullulanase [Anaerococcus sp.]MDY2927147.1 type I pullulanase [Anaerococcus sp.]
MIGTKTKISDRIKNLTYEEVEDEKLGAIYSKDKTTFRVFSPTSDTLDLLISDDYMKVRKDKYQMLKNEIGIYEITLEGDYRGFYYNYLVDNKYEVTDPYSFTASINSLSSVVVDMEETDPPSFREEKLPQNLEEDAIIYEMSVKNYTADRSSGIKNKGKFLGLTEEGSSFEGVSTGIDNIKELGVSHVQLLPIYDFISVDEDDSCFFDDDNYNWGYDPELYFAPEGSYATDPYDPMSRIVDAKKMIQTFHRNNISVVMDVVYNHTFKSYDSNLNTLARGYYHRMNEDGSFSNGSGVGNEVKSENAFTRKLIIDSLCHWVREYKVDGFRFDLMALIDLDTIKIALKKLKKINPNIIIYGEPWMAFYSPLPLDKQILKGAQRSNSFGVFNDDFRDAIKGDVNGYEKGYIQGMFSNKTKIETGIAGSIRFDDRRIGFADDANETINYFNCHDNLIIYDKLAISLNDTREIDSYIKLALGLIFLSFGKPFIYEGNEFNHSKNNDANSYRSPLSINSIKWEDKLNNMDIFNYTKDLIKLRKSIKVFSKTKACDIKKSLTFMEDIDESLVVYQIKSNNENYLVAINASVNEMKIEKEKLKTLVPVNKIIKIFSKKGINKTNTNVEEGLILESKSVNVFKIGDENGL